MTPIEAAYLERLRRRAFVLTPELARAELAAYDIIRNALSERELADAIRTGQVDRLINELLSDTNLDGAMGRLRARIDQAVADAARTTTMRDMPSPFRPQVFNVYAPQVIEAARRIDTAALTSLKTEVRATVRQVIVDGLAAGKNPRTIATRIPQVIGLSPNQARAVENFRTELLAGDRKALSRALARGALRTTEGDEIRRQGHAGGKGLTGNQLATLDKKLGEQALTSHQVDTFVESYRRRLLAWNTESHARSVALQANKHGQRAAWEDAAERGVVPLTALRRRWIAVGGPSGDGRNRPEHLEMHGEEVGFGEPFSNGELEPGDASWNCRCLARVVVVQAELRRAA